MSNGRVVEEGSYDSLVAQKGAFHALVNHQLLAGEDRPQDFSRKFSPSHSHSRLLEPPPAETPIFISPNASDLHVSGNSDSLEKGDIAPALPRAESRNLWVRLWGYVQKERYWFLGGSLAALVVSVSFLAFSYRPLPS